MPSSLERLRFAAIGGGRCCSAGLATAKATMLGLLALLFVAVAMPGAAEADQPSGRDLEAVPMSGDAGQWAVMADSRLRATLEGWSGAAGWTVVWDSPIDYRIRASAVFGGSFEEAVGRLIDAIYQSNPELVATLYRGNRVLHIQHVAHGVR